MIRPTGVEAREGHHIWLQYTDGMEEEVDLSHLAGQGVFQAWNNTERFEKVHVATHGAIAWNDDLELCPDELYMTLTGGPIEEVMPGVRALAENT